MSELNPGFEVTSLGDGILVALAITIVNTAASSLLAIDDEGFWYRNVVRRYQRRVAKAENLDVPGLFFLEIDGLAHDVLARAIRDGSAPTLARWVREGSHDLVGWETDWSSQTGACQAGLLHGSNEDMPAFRWWEKDRGARHRHQPPARRDGDRAPPLQRARAAVRRRREQGEHPLRRRAPHPADDEHRPQTRQGRAHRPGLLRLLRQPLHRDPHDRARGARGVQRALERPPPAPPGRASRASTAPSATRWCAHGRR